MTSESLDPIEKAARVVAGLEPLGGSRVQLRITYAGSWDGPLYITVSFDADGAEVVVIDPGEDFRSMVMATLTGATAEVAPSRTEARAAVTTADAASIRSLFDRAWNLGEGESRGTDGHWITADLFSPARGTHRGRDWCPTDGSLLRQLTLAAVHLAASAGVLEQDWVDLLSRR